MQLHYHSYPEQQGESHACSVNPPVIIIPGLFGSTANWRTFAKKLSQNFDVIVIDQRNHGESPHAPSHTYPDMVADLLEFIDAKGFEQVVLCGHSMGGKVAMLFSLLYPERVSRLAVLDIAPIEYEHSHAPYLRALMDIDLSTLHSRSDAEKMLKETIVDTPTRLFLMQSLVGKPGEYRWRLNLPVLLADMPFITGFPVDQVAGMKSLVDAAFIIGGNSDYVKQAHISLIEEYFPSVSFTTIEDAGHWLHAERPKDVLETLIIFLKNDK